MPNSADRSLYSGPYIGHYLGNKWMGNSDTSYTPEKANDMFWSNKQAFQGLGLGFIRKYRTLMCRTVYIGQHYKIVTP